MMLSSVYCWNFEIPTRTWEDTNWGYPLFAQLCKMCCGLGVEYCERLWESYLYGVCSLKLVLSQFGIGFLDSSILFLLWARLLWFLLKVLLFYYSNDPAAWLALFDSSTIPVYLFFFIFASSAVFFAISFYSYSCYAILSLILKIIAFSRDTDISPFDFFRSR